MKKKNNRRTKKKKQIEALEVLKSNIQNLTLKDAILENKLTEETKKELIKIKKIVKTVDKENFVYRTNKYIYSFKIF